MTKSSAWSSKVLALIKVGNNAAALLQIKVAPSVKDLRQLQKTMLMAGLLTQQPQVAETIADQIDALSAPRLHRSP